MSLLTNISSIQIFWWDFLYIKNVVPREATSVLWWLLLYWCGKHVITSTSEHACGNHPVPSKNKFLCFCWFSQNWPKLASGHVVARKLTIFRPGKISWIWFRVLEYKIFDHTHHRSRMHYLLSGLPNLLCMLISIFFKISGWRWVDGRKPIPTALRMAFAILLWFTGLSPVSRECIILPMEVT
jgi:hypothetical protein